VLEKQSTNLQVQEQLLLALLVLASILLLAVAHVMAQVDLFTTLPPFYQREH
jgi:hypothetical protein